MPGHTFSGDHGPVAVMQNGRQIAGAVKAKTSGTGRVELDSIYNASLPSVTVHGEGKQDKLEGKNLISISESFDGGRYNCEKEISAPLLKLTSTKEYSGGWAGFWVPVRLTSSKKYFIDCGILSKSNNDMRVTFSFWASDDPNMPTKEIRLSNMASAPGRVVFSLPPEQYYFPRLLIHLYGVKKIGDNIVLSNIMFSEGSAPTPYEPYCGGIPAPNPQYPIEPVFLEGASITDGTNTAPLPILRALPDGSVRDEMDVVSGTVVRKVNAREFNGSDDEFWKQENYGMLRYKIPMFKTGTSRIYVLCNRGIFAPSGQKVGACFISNSNFYYYPDQSLDSVEKFKSWLKTHPIEIWFEALETPIIEHYPPSILRQHPGYTQLIQQGGFAPAVIDAEYWKEMGE